MKKSQNLTEPEINETKIKIFKTAIKLLNEFGYDKLTIRKICEESNTSIGSFYHHFDNKDDLLSYYYTEAQNVYLTQKKAEIENKNIKEKLLLFYIWYVEYTQSFGLDFCTNFFNSKNKGINTNLLYNSIFETTVTYLDSAKDQIIDGRNYRQVANDLCVICKGIIFDWCTHDGDYDMVKYTDELVSLYLNSVIKE